MSQAADLVCGETFDLAFLESRYNAANWTEINHFRVRISEIQAQQEVVWSSGGFNTSVDVWSSERTESRRWLFLALVVFSSPFWATPPFDVLLKVLAERRGENESLEAIFDGFFCILFFLVVG